MAIEEVDDIFICMIEESGYSNSNVPRTILEYGVQSVLSSMC